MQDFFPSSDISLFLTKPLFLSVIDESKNETGYSFWHVDQETTDLFDYSGATRNICFCLGLTTKCFEITSSTKISKSLQKAQI
jgi:hypothetical protein